MTLVPFNKADLDGLKADKTKEENPVDTLLSFIKMDCDCVEITNYRYASSMSCHTTMHNEIKRLGLLGVKVIRRGDRLFLIKEQ